MKRISTPCRENWQIKLEEVGVPYHSHENGPYWSETAHYEFTAKEIDSLEKVANDLHQLCLEAANAVIENEWWDRLQIPEVAREAVLKSWNEDEFSLYGRFDVAYDGFSPPKLLEYNADTPTSLIEAAVAQWYWLEDLYSKDDQFNS